MALFNPSRDEVRDFFFDAWAKFTAQTTLTPLEKIAVEVMNMHGEYHAVLNQPEKYRSQAYYPEMGETNPFLHMSLHLSILEQVQINQPIGIARYYQALLNKHQDAMLAQHDLMDCLAETIWQAQRSNSQPDAVAYLNCMQSKAL